MSEMNSMIQMRNRMLKVFEDVDSGEIDIQQATCLAKLSETIVSGLRAEMQYAVLTNQQPYIPFFGEGSGKVIDVKSIKEIKNIL
jgi:hypothetical protein